MKLIEFDLKNRTASGTFHDGDFLLNQKGLRLMSDEKQSRVIFLTLILFMRDLNVSEN